MEWNTRAIIILLSAVLAVSACGCGKEPEPETTIDYALVENGMLFDEVDEIVTAKSETNLRTVPSQGEDSEIAAVLLNGDTAQRIAVSDSGWSKLVYQQKTLYAVSSLLTTDLDYVPPESTAPQETEAGIQTTFTPLTESVTAKDVVNLRSLPSVTNSQSMVIGKLTRGEVVVRTGVSDSGWSRLEVNHQTCYAVSSYLTTDLNNTGTTTENEGIQTTFQEVDENVTAKIEVNLRNIPSVTDGESEVIVKIKNGDIVKRTGINTDLGWSRVEYKGQILYCVSSYLEIVKNTVKP